MYHQNIDYLRKTITRVLKFNKEIATSLEAMKTSVVLFFVTVISCCVSTRNKNRLQVSSQTNAI